MNVPTSLNNLIAKVDDLDVANEAVKNTKFNTLKNKSK